MKTFFVGIDISKDWLDVAICDEIKFGYIETLEYTNKWRRLPVASFRVHSN